MRTPSTAPLPALMFTVVLAPLGALAVGCGGGGGGTAATDSGGAPATDSSPPPDTGPTAAAQAVPAQGLAPLVVAFESYVTGGDGVLLYAWDFGDGAVAALPDPVHTYTTPGAYDATLTVYDADGDTAVVVVPVGVGTDETPAATATATPAAGPAPLVVDLVCAATGGNAPLAYYWDFGDGGASPVAAATHTYALGGTYTATCTVTDADGSAASDAVAVTVATDAAPTALAAASYGAGGVPLAVSFTGVATGGDPPLATAWDFGDGATSALASPTHTYSAAGVWTALFTVTDADGDTAIDTVDVAAAPSVPADAPPVPAVTIVAGACAVPGATLVELDGSASTDPEGGALTFWWTFVTVPPGSTTWFNNSGVQNPTFVPDSPGTYTLRAFVSDGPNTVASPVVTVTASGPTSVAVVSGDAQTAGAGEPLAAPMEVHVTNACGADVPGRALRWSGADLAPALPETTTDAAGLSANGARGGMATGPAFATVTALGADAAPGAAATFTHTIVPGPPAAVVMDPPSAVVVPGPMPLAMHVTDQYLNPVSGTDVTFTLCAVAGAGGPTTAPSATFGSAGGPSCTTVATAGGLATAVVYDTVAETAYFEMSGFSLPSLVGVALVNVFFDDLEAGDDGGWDQWTDGPVEDWELGVPAVVGPPAAFSGSNVWGTDLDADYAPGGPFGETDRTVLRRTVSFGAAVAPWGPPAFPILREMEWLDVHHDSSSCCAMGGQVTVGTCDGGWCAREPDRGFDANDCCSGPGNSGQSGGWIQVWYGLGDFYGGGSMELVWTLARGGSLVTGAGWYLDDISVDLIVQWVPGQFLPGAPVQITTGITDGVAGCSDGHAWAWTLDAYGNSTTAPLTMSWSVGGSAFFSGVDQGTGFTGPGDPVTVSTVNGLAALRIADAVAESGLLVTVSDTAGVVTSGGNPISFVAPTPSEAGLCFNSIDDDCDGVHDCDDADCAGTPGCPVCGNGLCEPDEWDTCPWDCGPPPPSCECDYDGTCETWESPGCCPDCA